MLDLDSSLLMVVFLLWVLTIALNRIFFAPIGRILSERESKIGELEACTTTLSDQVTRESYHLEESLKNARRDAARIREDLTRQGESSRDHMVEEARASSSRLMHQKMNELDAGISTAEQKLANEIAGFCDQLGDVLL
jgi:F-type H+-transporting ATPase subunit b